MQNIEDKLFDLLSKSEYMDWDRQIEYLIAHGVTVQECGHWEDDHGDYVCSCCRKIFTDDLVWLVRGESNEPNYCPNCGAKMDGGNENGYVNNEPNNNSDL